VDGDSFRRLFVADPVVHDRARVGHMVKGQCVPEFMRDHQHEIAFVPELVDVDPVGLIGPLDQRFALLLSEAAVVFGHLVVVLRDGLVGPIIGLVHRGDEAVQSAPLVFEFPVGGVECLTLGFEPGKDVLGGATLIVPVSHLSLVLVEPLPVAVGFLLVVLLHGLVLRLQLAVFFPDDIAVILPADEFTAQKMALASAHLALIEDEVDNQVGLLGRGEQVLAHCLLP